MSYLDAAGKILGAYGSYQASKDQARALDDQAAQADANARAAKREAAFNASAQQIEGRKAMGSTKAGYAGAGVSGGSVDAVMMESAVNAEMDRLSIVFGGDVRATNFRSEAQAARSGAKATRKNAIFNAVAGGLGASGDFSKVGVHSGAKTYGGGTSGGDTGSSFMGSSRQGPSRMTSFS